MIRIINFGVTHIITWVDLKSPLICTNTVSLNVLKINENSKDESDNNSYPHSQLLFYEIVFSVMDFMRQCKMIGGTCLFVDDYNYHLIPQSDLNHELYFNPKLRSQLPKYFMRSIIIAALSYLTKLSVFDCSTLLNSKLLYFSVSDDSLLHISLINSMIFRLDILINQFPILRCICGSCTIILKRKQYTRILNQKHYDNVNTQTINVLEAYPEDNKIYNCTCSGNEKYESSCPSNNCMQYIRDMKEFYKVDYKSLNWASIYDEELLMGFRDDSSTISNELHKKIITMSRGTEANLVVHSNKEKSNRIYMRKLSTNINNYDNTGEETFLDSYTVKERIVLYKCKTCQVWMFGEKSGTSQISSSSEPLPKEYFLLMNNYYNTTKKVKENEIEFLLKSSQLSNIGLCNLLD